MPHADKPIDLFTLFVAAMAKQEFHQYENYYFTQCKG